jgi:hypothetical protein
MTPEIRIFLSNYLSSLSEETQETTAGRRFGFDHVIEQLGPAKGWLLYRRPSHPGIDGKLPKPKKEPEHGVDYAFFSPDRTVFHVLVLKDEALTYKNFRNERFDIDLSSAARQDLSLPEFQTVRTVRVILAYNKSEEEEGVEEYDRLAKSLGTKVGDHAVLEFERWNLDRLVTEVEEFLLTPALLPENFFRSLTYICWQVGDFTHGSNQWDEVLIPDWKELLRSLLSGEVTPRAVWMVAVALPIVRKHGKAEPSFETGWLDLLEWAMLALWRAAKRSGADDVRTAVIEVWLNTYVQDLDKFYLKHGDDLCREHALSTHLHYSFQPVAESYLAFWHLGRLGILWSTIVAIQFQDTPEMKKAQGERLGKIGGWMLGLMNANPGAKRPILDIHHVEYFLFWQAMFRMREHQTVAGWLTSIYEHLLVRRRRDSDPLRLISGDNDWESVFEFIVSGNAPSEGYGRSSYLMLMLLELGFSLPSAAQSSYLSSFYDHLVLGKAGDGGSLNFKETIELAGWAPPADWEDLTIGDGLDSAPNTGVSLMTHNFVERPHDTARSIAERVTAFVHQSRLSHPFEITSRIPFSVLALGCIKTRTPLPSEFWRHLVFPENRDAVPSSTRPV